MYMSYDEQNRSLYRSLGDTRSDFFIALKASIDSYSLGSFFQDEIDLNLISTSLSGYQLNFLSLRY